MIECFKTHFFQWQVVTFEFLSIKSTIDAGNQNNYPDTLCDYYLRFEKSLNLKTGGRPSTAKKASTVTFPSFNLRAAVGELVSKLS